MAATVRKHLSYKGLTKSIRECFEKVNLDKTQDPGKQTNFSLTNCLMSGFAVFVLKYESLLQFDVNCRGEEKIFKKNLKNIFHLDNIPSDTQLRERGLRPS